RQEARGARHRDDPESFDAGLRPGAADGPPGERRRAAGDSGRGGGGGRLTRRDQRPWQGMGHLGLHAGHCEVSRREDRYEDPTGRSAAVGVEHAHPKVLLGRGSSMLDPKVRWLSSGLGSSVLDPYGLANSFIAPCASFAISLAAPCASPTLRYCTIT